MKTISVLIVAIVATLTANLVKGQTESSDKDGCKDPRENTCLTLYKPDGTVDITIQGVMTIHLD